MRNDELNAYPWHSTAKFKAPLHRNQFGATLGGRILKDKTFFFGSYGGLRETIASIQTGAVVPSAAERNGNNSGYYSFNDPWDSAKLYNPWGGVDPVTHKYNTVFSCNGVANAICANDPHLDKAALALFSKFEPVANTTVTTNFGQRSAWQGSILTPDASDEFLIKIDHRRLSPLRVRHSQRTPASALRLGPLRLAIRPGDYLFLQFGHNDQKPHAVSLEEYRKLLVDYIEQTRTKGATPVLVTSVNRRTFDESGKITNSLAGYPGAMREVAAAQGVMLIDLNAMSKTLFEAMGPEGTLKAFMHYPANAFPNQTKAISDDKHFNKYGAYELARCVVHGIRTARLKTSTSTHPSW